MQVVDARPEQNVVRLAIDFPEVEEKEDDIPILTIVEEKEVIERLEETEVEEKNVEEEIVVKEEILDEAVEEEEVVLELKAVKVRSPIDSRNARASRSNTLENAFIPRCSATSKMGSCHSNGVWAS